MEFTLDNILETIVKLFPKINVNRDRFDACYSEGILFVKLFNKSATVTARRRWIDGDWQSLQTPLPTDERQALVKRIREKPGPKFISAVQIAEMLGVSSATIYNDIRFINKSK